MRQRSLHFRDLPLPLDQLLAEGGDGQAVFRLGAVEQLLLAAKALGFFANLRTDGVEVFAADRRNRAVR